MKTKELIRIIKNEIIAEKQVNNNINMNNQQINDLVIDIVEKINLKPHKTIQLVVSDDYNSGLSYAIYKEDLEICAEDLDIIVKNQNYKNNNVLKDYDRSVSMDYKYKKTIECTGYSQGDWDTYTIYYKVWNDQTQLLAELLSQLYTHKHDYLVEVNEILDHDHSKKIEFFGITINDVEFPDNERIREEIVEYCLDHDIKFNNIVYNVNN